MSGIRERPTSAPSPLSHYRTTVILRQKIRDLRAEIEEIRSFLLSRYTSQFREWKSPRAPEVEEE